MEHNTYMGTERRKSLKGNGNLEKLRKLTDSLSDTVIFKCSTFSELESSTHGKIIIMTLYADDNLGMVRFFASAGSTHVEHCHEMSEWIGVSSGKLIVHMNSDTIEVKQHDVILIPAGTPHTMEYPDNTWGFAVTMPSDKAF
jgi:quercetin dioxygenase-like cupin family protein